MKQSICIYTCLTNAYDTVKKVTFRDIPHYLFTDDPNVSADGWNVVQIPKTSDCRLQREYKILIPKELDRYDVVVYIDASMTLKRSFPQLLRMYRGGLMIGSHPKRKCVYAEGLAVKAADKAPAELVNKQIAEYYENDFPIDQGMYSAGFMVRDKSTREMCELWHQKLNEHSHRDQLSLPWALWKTGLKPITFNLLNFALIKPHKKKEPPKVFYSTPFRSDKNIGRANNEFIELLPDDAWVCITDGDAQFLLPNWGEQIENVIMQHGDEFDLIGCVTNRLGGLHQCYNNEFSEDMNVVNHYGISKDILENNGSNVVPISGIAGLCMIFSKETWKRAGGFKENIITADTEFNRSVKKIGGRIGMAEGIYMFHSYRLWEHGKGRSASQRSVKHLK